MSSGGRSLRQRWKDHKTFPALDSYLVEFLWPAWLFGCPLPCSGESRRERTGDRDVVLTGTLSIKHSDQMAAIWQKDCHPAPSTPDSRPKHPNFMLISHLRPELSLYPSQKARNKAKGTKGARTSSLSAIWDNRNDFELRLGSGTCKAFCWDNVRIRKIGSKKPNNCLQMNRQENKELQEERKYSKEANSKWRKMNGDLFNFIISYQKQEKKSSS